MSMRSHTCGQVTDSLIGKEVPLLDGLIAAVTTGALSLLTCVTVKVLFR